MESDVADSGTDSPGSLPPRHEVSAQKKTFFHGGKEYSLEEGDYGTPRFLAHGSYGHVSLWTHKADPEFQLAVKEMLLTGNEERLMRLQRDVEINARLQEDEKTNTNRGSCFVVKSYGSLLVRDGMRIFMEPMDTDLDKFCRKMKDQKIHMEYHQFFLGRLSYAVLNGLAYMKTQKFLHRDVKPDNILLRCDGSIKLCDFGLGVSVDAHSVPVTAVGVGARPYAAPERMLGDPYDERADVWSFGVTMFEVATGDHPYGTNWQAVLNLPAPQLGAESGLCRQLRTFINRCLQKEPDKRPYYKKEPQPLLEDQFLTDHDESSGIDSLVMHFIRFVWNQPEHQQPC